jgi:hypothetical protein
VTGDSGAARSSPERADLRRPRFEQVVRHRPGLSSTSRNASASALELVAQEVRDARGTPPATFRSSCRGQPRGRPFAAVAVWGSASSAVCGGDAWISPPDVSA